MAKSIQPIFVGSFPITQRFGENPARYAQFGLIGHDGVDFGLPTETTVLAGVEGRVLAVGDDPTGFGKYVKVFDPSQNLVLVFAHLNSIAPLVQTGAAIHPGNPVGGSGNTGNSTGPHLHFGAADADMAGNKINRENGYDGWKDPLDTNFVVFPQGFGTTTPPAGTTGAPTPSVTTAPGYTGAPPPPYAPSFGGQTVSIDGNNFRSDDGKTWIFQGTDAERAANDAATKAAALSLTINPKLTGLEQLKQKLAIEIATLNPERPNYEPNVQNQTVSWKGNNFRGSPGSGWSFQGSDALRQQIGDLENDINRIRAEIAAAPPLVPLPNIQATITPSAPPDQNVPPGTIPDQTPTTTAAPSGAWGGKKAPTHKDIYNKIAAIYQSLLDILSSA